MGEAARIYFGKDVTNLTLPESALLAGMIQSPNPYNPFRHEKRATERRNEVVRAMQDAGFIDTATMEEALRAPLLVEAPRAESTDAPYFVDLVRQQLGQRYEAKDLTTQNLSIYTTLDLHLQGLAQRALERGLDRVQELIKKRTTAQVQGSLIAIEPASGKVVALVGGRSLRAQPVQPRRCRPAASRAAPSSPSSTWPRSRPPSTTRACPRSPPRPWSRTRRRSSSTRTRSTSPRTTRTSTSGYVTLRHALAKSLNVATVKVAEMIGYDKVAALWSDKLGIGAPIKPFPAIALGSFEATPYEMATAYNVLANGGLKIEPVTILQVADEKRRVLEQHRAAVPERVVREESAFLVTDMLRSVLNEGTAAGARGLGFTRRRRGQDRHHERLPRRLVRRLHPRPPVRRLGRLRRQHPGGPLRHPGRPARSGWTS